MKRAYAKSQYAKPYESYCREQYPNEAEQIFREAERYYLEFMKDMPDLGENIMAKNMRIGSLSFPSMQQADTDLTAKHCSKSNGR